MTDLDLALAHDIAATGLRLAARQYAAVVDRIHAGESTQAQLRARQRALEAAAVEYAAAVAAAGGDAA
ncbi:MAG TPA: hypothetical protein VII06_33360 [Chloroflexota bacterium]|jgi:hypothetical protein